MSLEILPGETHLTAYRRIYIKPIVQTKWDELNANPENAAKYLNGEKVTVEGKKRFTELFKEIEAQNEAHFREWQKRQKVLIKEINPSYAKKVLSEVTLPDARKMVVYTRGSKEKVSVIGADGTEQKYHLAPIKKRDPKPKDPSAPVKESEWHTWLKGDQAKAIRENLRKEALADHLKAHPEDVGKVTSVKVAHSVIAAAVADGYHKDQLAKAEAAKAAAPATPAK